MVKWTHKMISTHSSDNHIHRTEMKITAHAPLASATTWWCMSVTSEGRSTPHAIQVSLRGPGALTRPYVKVLQFKSDGLRWIDDELQ